MEVSWGVRPYSVLRPGGVPVPAPQAVPGSRQGRAAAEGPAADQVGVRTPLGAGPGAGAAGRRAQDGDPTDVDSIGACNAIASIERQPRLSFPEHHSVSPSLRVSKLASAGVYPI